MRNKTSTLPIMLTILLILALCCLCISLVLITSGALLIDRQGTQPTLSPTILTIQMPTPTSIPTTAVDPQTPKGEEYAQPNKPAEVSKLDTPFDTIDILAAAEVPISDLIELAERLEDKRGIPKTLTDPLAPYQVGDSKSFWVTNVDDNSNFRITATVRYVGETMYFWTEDGVDYFEEDIQALGKEFDYHILPITRALFGDEWSPGVTIDPRIHILYATGLGQSLAGYFSSVDQLPPQVHEYSNGHEMFLINADTVPLWNQGIYSTFAHELQHMIHWHIDRNEETWLNEGFSMLTELINGYDPSGFDYLYAQNTDLQLTDWGSTAGSNGPHYGASMLFATYFYDRFGEEATQALITEQKNGMEGITTVLAHLEIKDPLTGQIITAEDLFTDWAVTNILGDPHVADGRYHYRVYPEAPLAKTNSTVSACPISPIEADVAQFGVDYIRVSCLGDHRLVFNGEAHTSLLPIEPYSGETYFWSNRGDHSNTSLQRTFDLTTVQGEVEMTFRAWYDLETDYDYAFVSASIDGTSWTILSPTSCTIHNPSGNSYGCGYNGKSNGWLLEALDLTPYAGSEVIIRFDYVTDAAVIGDGLVIDDIRLDAIDYFTDFESDSGGWQADGFVRVQNSLPQYFRVSMISYGEKISVTPLALNEHNSAEINFNLGKDVDSIILVISGTTPYTRQRANYKITIE